MLDYNDRAFRFKIVFGGLLIPAVLGAVLLWYFYRYSVSAMIESAVSRVQAVCDTAEKLAVRQASGMAVKGQGEQTVDPVTNVCPEKIYLSDDSSYELNVVGIFPIEQKKMHVSDESEGLGLMISGGIDEYYSVDEQGEMRYLRAIRVTKTCLDCHGDPKSSRKLWASIQGVSKVPVDELTGWENGQICGAFEVTESLAGQKKELVGVVASTGIVLLTGLTFYAVLFLLLVFWVVRQYDEVDMLDDDSQSDDITHITLNADNEEIADQQEKINC